MSRPTSLNAIVLLLSALPSINLKEETALFNLPATLFHVDALMVPLVINLLTATVLIPEITIKPDLLTSLVATVPLSSTMSLSNHILIANAVEISLKTIKLKDHHLITQPQSGEMLHVSALM